MVGALKARVAGYEAWWPYLVAVLALGLGLVMHRGAPVYLHYFVPLADAFLHGRLDVLDHPAWLNELVPFQGKYYVVYPPMPAVLLMPFVALFGPGFNQAVVSLGLGAANAFLAAGVFHRMGQRGLTWVLFSLLLPLGTIAWYSAAAATSWHFAHVCALFFLLLAIRDVQVGAPPWRLGLWLGAATLSRSPCLGAVPFAVAYLAWKSHGPGGVFGALGSAPGLAWPRWRPFLRDVLAFGLVFGGLMALYMVYNWARFGSPSQTGHELIPGLLAEYQYRHGFFAVQSIPRKLYAMLLTMPRLVEAPPFLQVPVLGGLSLLLTTPVFLWAVKARARDWATVGAWAAIALTLVPILLHADPGGEQFGFRYAQDFYPFLMLLAARGVGARLSFEAGLAFALAFLVNLWGMWGTYVGFRA